MHGDADGDQQADDDLGGQRAQRSGPERISANANATLATG